MAVTFSLVATIAREIDNMSAIRAPLVIAGDRVMFYVSRATVGSEWELWRSDDRGVNWTHHTINAFAGAKRGLFLSQGFWWMYDGNNTEFRRTSEANPGAGGFASSAMNFSDPNDFAAATEADVVHMQSPRVGGLDIRGPVAIAGEPPATTIIGNLTDNTAGRGIVKVPGLTNDLLLLQQNGKMRRIRVSPMFSLEADFTLTGTDDGAERPFPNVAAHTSSVYWGSTDRDVEPSKAWRSTNSGASYTEVNLAADFWSDVPGVTAERRKGLISMFVRLFGNEYAFVKYVDMGGNPAQTDRHAKLAKFNGTTLAVESNRVADGNVVWFAGGGLNAAGNADFYVVTMDEAGNVTRVYRATEQAPGDGGFTLLRGPRVRPWYAKPGRPVA